MDFASNPNAPGPDPQSISIRTTGPRKLPIKRKISSPSVPDNPNPNPTRKPQSAPAIGDADEQKPPPFKFHRIWTEPDEIRFLQGLLNCSSDGLSFPRDLHVFYNKFSETMSQPYSKSQLSEKLRRLRKKFRVIMSRLARGLAESMLSSHDRALFELSCKLWHPDFQAGSPFGRGNSSFAGKKNDISGLVVNTISNTSNCGDSLPGVEVESSSSLPPTSSAHLHEPRNTDDCNVINYDDGDIGDDNNSEHGDDVLMEMNEVKVDYDFGVREDELLWGSSASLNCESDGLGKVVAKTAIEVFKKSLDEFRGHLVQQGLLRPDNALNSESAGKELDFEKRWKEQKIAELDVLGCRLRLVIENSLKGQ